MSYSYDELDKMKGTRVGDIINHMYKKNSKLNTYTKTSYCGKFIFIKHGINNFDFSYKLR